MQQERLEVGAELVLAGLAREDNGEGQPALFEDGGGDGAGGFELIGP